MGTVPDTKHSSTVTHSGQPGSALARDPGAHAHRANKGTLLTDILPAVECASWCAKGDGHTDVHDPAYQHCESRPRAVLLSRYPLLGVGTEPRVRDHLVGLIHREAGASVPHIMVQHKDAMMIDLSVDDALRLAVDLLTMAEAART